MIATRVLRPALAIAATLAIAGTAAAGEPEAVTTAPAAGAGAPPSATTSAPASSAAAPAPTSIADQIDTYLKTSPAAALPKDGATGVTGPDEPRKVHGMVDVAVGTNGYRSAFVQSDLPVGKTGTLSIAVGETQFKGRVGGRFGGVYGSPYYRGYGLDRQNLALGLRLGGETALEPRDPRCRRTGEDTSDLRPDQRFEDGRPRPCPAAEAPTPPQ